MPQSRLKSCGLYHPAHRAAEAARGRRPCSAGTTKSRAGSVADTAAPGKTIRRDLHSALLQASCISNGHTAFSCFSSAGHSAAVLSCFCNPPQSKYYILVTPQLLGWIALKPARCSTSCHKADLTVRSAQSCFWFLIYDFSLLSSFSTVTVQCFNFTGSQLSRLSPVEVWGSKRNASEVCSDAQKLIWAVTEGRDHVTLSSFFQALSQLSTSQSSRALFCNSLRESGIKYLYSNINKTIKNAGSSKHLRHREREMEGRDFTKSRIWCLLPIC